MTYNTVKYSTICITVWVKSRKQTGMTEGGLFILLHSLVLSGQHRALAYSSLNQFAK